MVVEDNEYFSVIIPDYLLDNEEDPVVEDLYDEDPYEEIPLEEDPVEEDPEEDPVDYSSILQDINDRLDSLENTIQENNDNITTGIQGLLNNTQWVVYFGFAFFVFGALVLVIKFFKSFF